MDVDYKKLWEDLKMERLIKGGKKTYRRMLEMERAVSPFGKAPPDRAYEQERERKEGSE
jgi:hypothetical protein